VSGPSMTWSGSGRAGSSWLGQQPGGLLVRDPPGAGELGDGAHVVRVKVGVEQMARFHPAGDLWFLPLLGVDPVAQGRGLGSALLRHGLAACDRDGLPAYLEATNPRNRALYERHGFRVGDVIQAGSSPPMRAMLREPRTGDTGPAV
jgi:ribosomal protein S18 acetylase RimI-like enzyme